MPERPLTIAAYAAGASLAAVTLVYVFGPTFFLDDDAANSSRSSRKKGVVGLVNPANDCFINSVLQTLAGLPELRVYLIRETHRRKLDGPEPYNDLSAALEEQQVRASRDGAERSSRQQTPEWKILGLQEGLVTAGLKDVLDALNERPIYRKTISAQGFVRVMEQAFRTRVSRTQQDAQEFFQVIAERLADEHRAGRTARRRARKRQAGALPASTKNEAQESVDEGAVDSKMSSPKEMSLDTEYRRTGILADRCGDAEEDDADEGANADESILFPFEGKLESQVECSFCHFRPRPAVSSFVSLTLHVPQVSSSTTLNACLDGMLKVEQIDDFTCDRCRLEHALQVNARKISRLKAADSERKKLEDDQVKLQNALDADPETPPEDVQMPDRATAPKRRISRHMRISSFPRILAIHLSRSMWDPDSISTKNVAKVSFPESLPLGGLIDRKNYRLLGLVTHKGGHNSGHYESFRRQFLPPPYSTPANMGTEGIYSFRNSPVQSSAPSPRLGGTKDVPVSSSNQQDSQGFSTPSSTDSSVSRSSLSLRAPEKTDLRHQHPANIPLDAIPTPGLPSPPPARDTERSEPTTQPPKRSSSISGSMRRLRRKRGPDRWWRISDDQVKESKTGDVLAMQREVYMLFYEMVDESVGRLGDYA